MLHVYFASSSFSVVTVCGVIVLGFHRLASEVLTAWLREAAGELDKAHDLLDYLGVPRSLPDSENECTLAGRISLLADMPPIEPS